MELLTKMANLQLVLVVYLICGIICNKLGIITKNNQGKFTSFVLNILMPCMVFQSFKAIDVQTLGAAASAFLISLLTCFFAWIVGRVVCSHMPESKQSITRYAILINNAGFAGLPLAQQAFGDVGLIFASVYLIPIRIFMWSAGTTMLSGTKVPAKELLVKLATNPNIIAVFLGLARGLAGIPLPFALDSALSNLSGCVSPCSMIIIGAIIARVDVRTILGKDVLFYCLIRLIALPCAVLAILQTFQLPVELVGTCTILCSMPAATTTALLADSYGQDTGYASRLVCTSTLLSILTAPLLMMLL